MNAASPTLTVTAAPAARRRNAPRLARFSDDPVLGPNPGHDWENLVVTNPGAWQDPATGRVWLLYRAAGDDPRYIVHLGLAASDDGYHFERVSDRPVLSPLPGFADGGGVEDPRIVKLGDWFYLTYACRPFPNGQYWRSSPRTFRFSPNPGLPAPFDQNGMMTALAFSRDLRAWTRAGLITEPGAEDHDVILFPETIGGRYYYLHRPIIDGEAPGIWLADTDNPLRLRNSRPLAMPREDWEGIKIGGNAPPLRTRAGWLVLYHGVGLDRFYRLGALLLDRDNPDRVIARTRAPIFAPEAWYELGGCHNYEGVVFPCGQAVVDGAWVVYYGAADKYIGIAHARLDDFLRDLVRETP